ncbi:mitochondrial small ribosomal subunit Rsm22-domain-containing protein [Syncephalastrum racemosum]|uniref:Mitochondrial small ribosomal subunit Rsm22-domain-containing protein n=1 Tax=Syncephalastrum racemosum TaxID=13706 RepID=A0A1X2H674_SYNRA|nr:mitochondrial small ribosomal subunit Rsm22-domain-containing protein [Syncephalastrum racemosum]
MHTSFRRAYHRARPTRRMRPLRNPLAKRPAPVMLDPLDPSGQTKLPSVEAILAKQQLNETSEEPIERGSPEARHGRKYIGSISLPQPLIKGTEALIEACEDKKLIRTDALRIYESFRSTAKAEAEPVESNTKGDKKKKNNKPAKKDNNTDKTEPHALSYGPRESLAYVAGAMPSTYAAVTNVLNELNKRLSNFSPKTMLDFGTGPGTAIWAARSAFSGIESFAGVDLSEDMLNVAEHLEKALDSPRVEWTRYLAVDPNSPKTDLVVSAFTLGELPSVALQTSVVKQVWDQTGDILVLIDRGTPVGFANIARARQTILDMEAGGGAHVVAPCSHDALCPLLYSEKANPNKFWCHFSQRVQRPPYLMKTKHAKSNLEDAKYAYVVLRRGARPTTAIATASMEQQSYDWPRLVQPPIKNQGHTIMDVCAKEGEIQRMTIPKSQGKVPYRDARKAMWGDLFPHPSKNKVITRVPRAQAVPGDGHNSSS